MLNYNPKYQVNNKKPLLLASHKNTKKGTAINDLTV